MHTEGSKAGRISRELQTLQREQRDVTEGTKGRYRRNIRTLQKERKQRGLAVSYRRYSVHTDVTVTLQCYHYVTVYISYVTVRALRYSDVTVCIRYFGERSPKHMAMYIVCIWCWNNPWWGR